MSYEALYRKYRPRQFSEIIGQIHVTRALTNALDSGRPAHAYLFTGQRGTGKTTTARILAKAANCEKGIRSVACDECGNCAAIATGSSLDLIELDAASHTGVDGIREAIVDKVDFQPASARHRIYIIDEAHMLSTSAFNALLKTLEEPPAHALFILCTTEPYKIPPTIHSRCQRFDFRPVSAVDIAAHLESVLASERAEGVMNVDAEPLALRLIARAAGGSVRDALSALDQATIYAGASLTGEQVRGFLGMASDDILDGFAEALADGDVACAWGLVGSAAEEGRDLHQLIQDLKNHLRELLMVKLGAESSLELEDVRLEPLRRQAGRFAEHSLIRMLQIFSESDRELRMAGDTQLALELIVLRAIGDQIAPAAGDEKTESESVHETTVLSPGHEVPEMDASPEQSIRSHGEAKEFQLPEPRAEDASPLEIHWGQSLDRVKESRMATHALLLDAQPESLEDGTLTVVFGHAFNRDAILETSHREFVEQVLTEVLGHSVRLKAIVSQNAEKQEISISSIAEPLDNKTVENVVDASDLPEDEFKESVRSLFGDVPIEDGPSV